MEKLEKAMKRLEEQIKFAELIKLDSISVFTSDAKTIIEALKNKEKLIDEARQEGYEDGYNEKGIEIAEELDMNEVI